MTMMRRIKRYEEEARIDNDYDDKADDDDDRSFG